MQDSRDFPAPADVPVSHVPLCGVREEAADQPGAGQQARRYPAGAVQGVAAQCFDLLLSPKFSVQAFPCTSKLLNRQIWPRQSSLRVAAGLSCARLHLYLGAAATLPWRMRRGAPDFGPGPEGSEACSSTRDSIACSRSCRRAARTAAARAEPWTSSAPPPSRSSSCSSCR